MFERDNFREIPSENVKYLSNVILTIQPVSHSTKDKDKDVINYSHLLLDECCYGFFVDTRKIDPCLKRKKEIDSRLKHKKKSELNLNLRLIKI